MNRFEQLKRSYFVAAIMYRKEIRKKVLKILILLNGVLFLTSIVNNMPSMVLFILNMYYLIKYMHDEYPESKFRLKDRYKGMKE